MADPIVVKVSALPELTELATDDLFSIVDISELVTANKTKKIKANNLKVFNSAQVADGIVTVTKLAADSVETLKIKDLNVVTTKLADNAVTNPKLRDSAALSVIGNTSNALADPEDIAAGVDGQVLRRSGNTLGFGTIASAGIANGAVGESQISNGAVTSGKLGAKAVTTQKIADGAVTQTQLGAIRRTVAIPVFGREDAVIAKNFTRIFAWLPMLNGHIVVGASAVLLGGVSSSGSVGMTLTNQNGAMATITIPQGQWSANSGTINSAYYTAQSFATFSINVTSAGSGAVGLTVYLEVLG